MNQNTEYERFTQEIYQQLVDSDVVIIKYKYTTKDNKCGSFVRKYSNLSLLYSVLRVLAKLIEEIEAVLQLFRRKNLDFGY